MAEHVEDIPQDLEFPMSRIRLGTRSSNSSHSGRSTNLQPLPVVLNTNHLQPKQESKLSLKEDLWLSTVDGRYSSMPMPVHVGEGSARQTFYVHRDILCKSEWFQAAMCGPFKEANEGEVNLPEEDPAIFHFLVAFLYEDKFTPLKPASSALEPACDKGKGRAQDCISMSTPSNTAVGGSRPGPPHNDAGRRRPGPQPDAEEQSRPQTKRLGHHRPDCFCPQCLTGAERCWQCGAPSDMSSFARRRQPPNPGPGMMVPFAPGLPPAPGPPVAEQRAASVDVATVAEGRLTKEDLRTWLMAYELTLEVYICANRFLMEPLKKAVARSCIDMLEAAGSDAAVPEVLTLCNKLYAGVPETDPLLKMVLARVGFLQPLLWKRAPITTSEFLVANPEIAAQMLRDTVMRHETFMDSNTLPAMESHNPRLEAQAWRRARVGGRAAVAGMAGMTEQEMLWYQ
ncbi:hypothetical protein S7711_07837 [Stachybotrys chartarum IBT 7711]|uniref:BTB domain-containing protein n=1 Tax=Stachybotrys chartarum (strain CBS 109288 / IBT 7711) TaxID=1280523 RepID=A0A084AQR0_STACB|nr:hypothetical protein S7711_07837 [Stachybotrys chartarum IBT 7711]